ncbi:hypothetical protein BD770DRAFT_410509 [Pilaira anomala]|nr:hypothetical protein BD770DRAFT_410509 [Pilaira anomala]
MMSHNFLWLKLNIFFFKYEGCFIFCNVAAYVNYQNNDCVYTYWLLVIILSSSWFLIFTVFSFVMFMVCYNIMAADVYACQAVKHWTMMTPEPGVYIMTKEQKATIPVNINRMADDLISYVRFHLNLTESLRETLDSIEGLQKEHRSQLQEVTINNKHISAETLLSSVVKPVIIRLNEGKHSKEVVDSPRSSSNSPQSLSLSISLQK